VSFHFPWRHDPHRAERMHDLDDSDAPVSGHGDGPTATIVYAVLVVVLVVIVAAAIVRIV